MEAILEKVSKGEKSKGVFDYYGYMARIYDVQSPCQWLMHCYKGKCPAFVKVNGNFYCAKSRRVS